MFKYTQRILNCALILSVTLGLAATELGSQAVSKTSQTEPTKLMEFTGFDWEDVMSRLDYLDRYIRDNSPTKAYVFVYGGRREDAPGGIDARLKCVQDYLIDRRSTPRKAFDVLKGGYRERATIEFWVSSLHSLAPKPTATISPKSVKYRHRHKNWTTLCND